MLRRKKLLSHVDSKKPGVEIGGSHQPITPKSAGFNVHTIDHASKEELIKKYSKLHIGTEKIEEVDYIWEGEPFAILTKGNKYSWILASHVIEHTPDFIGFIQNCESILSDNGVLILAIPDKRYCFDKYRPTSSLSSIIDSHLSRKTRHSPGFVADFYLNSVENSRKKYFGVLRPGIISPIFTKNETIFSFKKSMSSKEYIDIHSWCFTPYTFQLILQDLVFLGYLKLNIIDFFYTYNREFHAILSRAAPKNQVGRKKLQIRAYRETSRPIHSFFMKISEQTKDIIRIFSRSA